MTIDTDFINNFVSKLTVGGVPALLMVILVVWWAKKLGASPKIVPVITLLAGMAAALIITLTPIFPAVVNPVAQFITLSLVLSFAGSGAYAQAKRLLGYQTVPPDSLVKYPDGTTQVITKP